MFMCVCVYVLFDIRHSAIVHYIMCIIWYILYMVCIVLHVLNIHMSPVDGRQSIEAPA